MFSSTLSLLLVLEISSQPIIAAALAKQEVKCNSRLSYKLPGGMEFCMYVESITRSDCLSIRSVISGTYMAKRLLYISNLAMGL